MNKEMTEREVECIADCLLHANVALQKGNITSVKNMLQDAMKSISTLEGLSSNEHKIFKSKKLV